MIKMSCSDLVSIRADRVRMGFSGFVQELRCFESSMKLKYRPSFQLASSTGPSKTWPRLHVICTL